MLGPALHAGPRGGAGGDHREVTATLTGRATAEATAAHAAARPAAAGHWRRAGDLTVSSVGLGTYLGPEDEATDAGYAAALARALELECNVVDTAANYRYQRSERVVGRTLAELVASGRVERAAVVVATKAGFLPGDSAHPGGMRGWVEDELLRPGVIDAADIVAGCHCMTPAYLRHQLAESLRNLGVDCIDIHYLHNPETQLSEVDRPEFRRRVRDAFATLEAAVAAGEVGVYGVATWDGLRADPSSGGHLSLEELAACAVEVAGDAHHFRAVQLPLNVAMPEAAVRPTQRGAGGAMPLLAAAAERGMTVMASGSLLQARVIGRLPEALRDLLGGPTDAQSALQFTRSAPGLTTALVGMSRVDHVEENLALAARPPLDPDGFAALFR
ncbi:MAG: aldo/keto reductase [Chloroflexi bacterium]|nr:MAG: aldo/keto reductase [Chloroflexota bacterium]